MVVASSILCIAALSFISYSSMHLFKNNDVTNDLNNDVRIDLHKIEEEQNNVQSLVKNEPEISEYEFLTHEDVKE